MRMWRPLLHITRVVNHEVGMCCVMANSLARVEEAIKTDEK